MKLRLFGGFCAAAFCGILFLVFTAGGSQGGELRVSMRRDTGSADPLSAKSTLQLLPDLFLPLVRPPLVGGGAYQAALASKWEKISSTSLRFFLGSNKWSDGSKITSDDVVYTIETIKKNVSSPFHDIVCQFGCWILKIEGPLAFVITTVKPQNSLLDRLADVFIVPKTREGKKDWGRNPVVSGAYRIKEWRHQREVVLEENPHALFRPQIKAKRYVFFRDLDAIARAVESRMIDAGYAAPEQQARFDKKKGFFLRKYPYPAAVTLALNRAASRSKEDQKALNSCLSASLDEHFKRYLVNVATLGAGQVARTFWHPDVQFLQSYVPAPAPAPGSAVAKCSFAGRLLLITEAGFEEYAKVAKILAKRLSASNIRVEIKYILPSALRETINFRKEAWDLFVGEFPTSRSPRFPDFSTSLADPPTHEKFSENIVSYENPKALEAVRAIEHGTDVAAAFGRLAAAFQDDPPAHPLYTVNDSYVFSKEVFVVGADVEKVKINHVFRFYPETLSLNR